MQDPLSKSLNLSKEKKMDKFSFLIVLCFLLNIAEGGITSKYVRTPWPSVDMPKLTMQPPAGYNAPEQVHLTQGDYEGKRMIITWVTPLEEEPNAVIYWEANAKHKHKAHAKVNFYKYYNYTSGYIHHAVTSKLESDTLYYYELGAGNGTRRFSFKTPPQSGPDVPYTFGIMGDLGQTSDSNQTFHHYLSDAKGQAVLYVGDLSYADDHPNHDNTRWDTWGRFVEKSNAFQPWIWTAGNHEIDYAPEIGEPVPFKPYKHRYHVPYKSSGSTSPLWYSVKHASAYIIALSSYSAYAKYTPQYNWLQQEFPKINRTETPWVIVLLHSPMYNSNNYHFMEGESARVVFEPWFVQNKVDLVLSGHVHSYERSERVSNVRYNITDGLSTPVKDPSAPIYITIGDGGNIEGIANNYIDPQPSYSAYREASFGHALLEIKNRTHARFSWHRNQDNERVEADYLWLHNRQWYPVKETNSAHNRV